MTELKPGTVVASQSAAAGLKTFVAMMPETHGVRMHGSFRYPVYPGWKKGRQLQEDMHLLYVRGGEGYYQMDDGAELTLKRGSLVLVSNAYPYHAVHRSDDPLLISGLRFGLYRYGEYGERACYQTPTPFYIGAEVEDVDRYDEMTGKIHALVHGDMTAELKKMAALLTHQLIYELYASLLGGPIEPVKEATEVQRAIRYIEAHAERRLSIAEVAREAGISIRSLQKRFKSEVGLTPKSYQLMVQMDLAYKCLYESGMKVADVAALLGYSDAYTFSHQFKKHWGTSPLHVRMRRL